MLQITVGTSTSTLKNAFGYRCTTLPTASGAPTSVIKRQAAARTIVSAPYVPAIQCATNAALNKPNSSIAKYATEIASDGARRQEQRFDSEPPAEQRRADVREQRWAQSEPQRGAEEHARAGGRICSHGAECHFRMQQCRAEVQQWPSARSLSGVLEQQQARRRVRHRDVIVAVQLAHTSSSRAPRATSHMMTSTPCVPASSTRSRIE